MSSLLQQAYLGVEQALQSTEVVDHVWKDWFHELVISPGEKTQDPIDCLATQMAETLPDLYSQAKLVMVIGEAVNEVSGAQLTRIPFAARMMTPTAFYEKHPEIADLARQLHCPVSYAEGAEVIGLATINPVAGLILKEELVKLVEASEGYTPFISLSLINHRGWGQMNHKHFNWAK